MPSPRRRRGGAVLAASMLCSIAAGAQVPAASVKTGAQSPAPAEQQSVQAMLAELDRDPNTIVADVNGRSVTRADVAMMIRTMPPLIASRPTLEVYQLGVGAAIQQTALAVRATDAGLDKLPSVASRLRAAKEDVLADVWLRGALNANLTDDVLKHAYDVMVAGKPGPEQVKARIIATDTEDDAEAAIERIKAGATFEAVARTDSKDPTSADGGEIGYIGADVLAPELSAVLFSLAVGAMTPHAVQSGDHWFVLKNEGRQAGPAPTFEQARQSLAHDLALVEVPRIKQKVVSEAKIAYHSTIFDPAAAQAGK